MRRSLIHFKLALACLCLLLTLRAAAAAPSAVISEFMASNSGSLLDEDGEASDWIEIHNPTDARINLDGWFLTDDLSALGKWRFPARFLEPGAHLVVFASGKNRVAGGNLHTNFRLDAAGEYLALVRPDRQTVATEFRPKFPLQDADISYGIPASSARNLLGDILPSAIIPASATDLTADWMQPDAGSLSGWRSVAGFGLGFDNVPAGSGDGVNLALGKPAVQSSTGFELVASNGTDGNVATFTHTTSDDDASSWQVDLGATFELSRIVLRNRQDCCGSRFRDLTVNLLDAAGKVVWSSELLNPENILSTPSDITIDLFESNAGLVQARVVQVVRTPDPDLSGSGGSGNGDEDNVLSLGEVEVYGVDAVSFGSFIRTDLTDLMKGRNSSLFVRVPFEIESLDAVQSLQLQMLYDDGVIAYLNGQKVAEFNAPASPQWNSVAPQERTKANVLQPVIINLEAYRSAWRQGANWLAFHAINASVGDSEFLLDAKLLAETTGAAFIAYLESPTPGATNSANWNLGTVADTTFSVDRGIYQTAFDLAISTATPGAEIRYTLDGSLPEENRGLIYTGPIRIGRTTVVRAAAFKRDYRPTNVDTHTYLFLYDVIRQPRQPAGFPSSWADVAADYAMDTRITQAPAYESRMEESLLALPSLSITTPLDNLFGSSRGIYANPERNGSEWERPVSMEWIQPDGTREFQVDCGLRIQGGYFRQRHVTQKHSLRLLFKKEYGAGKLREDLFHEFGAAREFDTLVLRAGANDGYAWGDARDTEQFLRDEFGRRTFLEMGQPSARGRFVHLYLNGLYWGVYNLAERPAEDFSSTYMGGEPEEWDAINSGDVKSGSLDAWNQFTSIIRSPTMAKYQQVKGLNPDGSVNSSYPVYFDGPNYMDYMLLNIWGGNWDWPNKNFWFGRHRGGLAGGFKFYLWDFENTMGNNRGRSPLEMVSPRDDVASSWVGEPHYRLKNFSEYKIEFADRVQRHFFGAGALSPASLLARYSALATALEPAIIAETARWGDDNHSTPQDLADWRRERDWLLNTYLTQRTGITLAQLKSQGLFPVTAAPRIAPFGGTVTSTTPIVLSAAATSIYYTTNGIDPRLPGGGIHPDATRITFSNGSQTNVAAPLFLASAATIKTRARQGTEWSALSETAFKLDVVPATANELVVSEVCYRPADPATPQELAISDNRDDYEFIEVMNVSAGDVDLTGVRFAVGILFNFSAGSRLGAGERLVVVKDREAFQARYGTAIRVEGEFDGNLSNSGEEVAMVDAAGKDISRFHFLDRAPWPPSANRNGFSLVLIRPETKPNPKEPLNWRGSVLPGGTPGGTDTVLFSGEPTADLNLNGQGDLLDHAFGALLSEPGAFRASMETFQTNGLSADHLVVSFPRNLSADDAEIILETAETIDGPWENEAEMFELIREERLPGGISRLSLRLTAPKGSSAFIRFSVSLH
ncbi:MAG: lamin tail domain-containing protein [Verrucomicrobiales bacterium]